MAKKKESYQPKAGDIVSWVSSAAGGSKVKIGKMQMTPHDNEKTTHVEVAASYDVTSTNQIGKCEKVVLHKREKTYTPYIENLEPANAKELAAYNKAVASWRK